MSDKYLRKNEFRYDTNPKYKNKKGKGHTVYVSVQHGDRSKVNAITHGKNFNLKRTKVLSKNPEVGSKYKNQSRVSMPFWEENKYIQNKAKGIWRFCKEDRVKIKKMNRKDSRKKQKNKNSRAQ